MRKEIFLRAEGMKGRVTQQGTSFKGDKEFYTFTGEDGKEDPEAPIVTLACDGKKTYIDSCTCKHCAVHGAAAEMVHNRLVLCSYKLAVLKALPLIEVLEDEDTPLDKFKRKK